MLPSRQNESEFFGVEVGGEDANVEDERVNYLQTACGTSAPKVKSQSDSRTNFDRANRTNERTETKGIHLRA